MKREIMEKNDLIVENDTQKDLVESEKLAEASGCGCSDENCGHDAPQKSLEDRIDTKSQKIIYITEKNRNLITIIVISKKIFRNLKNQKKLKNIF